jgi:hypothetical protein
MKAIGSNHIDYWQHFYLVQRGLKNRFGVRIQDGHCWALIQIADQRPMTFGQRHDIPVDLSILPSYLCMIVDNYQLNYPSSDLVEVLAGKKSFRSSIDSPTKIVPKRATATAVAALRYAS